MHPPAIKLSDHESNPDSLEMGIKVAWGLAIGWPIGMYVTVFSTKGCNSVILKKFLKVLKHLTSSIIDWVTSCGYLFQEVILELKERHGLSSN
ncbi:hypothetical protein WICPIJ_004504 [Wickerhamomyces pijperi]|uniref:Uncharacterized protein n=1 Tax=Wickerhamomyces pijperi TaxID=599730 RepID=A0A9P8Q5J9_WICPI|nr:hypothetical protein WICPIJ_004504 [Wickerhamomyces pijperi]